MRFFAAQPPHYTITLTARTNLKDELKLGEPQTTSGDGAPKLQISVPCRGRTCAEFYFDGREDFSEPCFANYHCKRSHPVNPPPSKRKALWHFIKGSSSRAELKVTHLRWSPICGFLRKSAVFCEKLRPPDLRCLNFQQKG